VIYALHCKKGWLGFELFNKDISTSKVSWHKLDERMSTYNELEAEEHHTAVVDIWSGNL
jgi:hypothetical protein